MGTLGRVDQTALPLLDNQSIVPHRNGYPCGAAIEKMISAFTEDEAEVYRRGRNAKKATKSKHASVGEYNRSTGLEAVIGYLYLSGEKERINELLSLLAEEDFSVKTPVEPYKGQR